jgi:putative membrane protein
MKNAILIGTIALALAAAPAYAKGKKHARSGNAKAMSDQAFVTEAAKGGMAEVELGKLAQEKGSSAQVKTFGERMVTDHGKANDELQTLAKNKSITLPSGLAPKDKALRDRLAKLSGDAFDRAYMNAMLTDHRKDVAAFKHESETGKDPDVKSFASKTLPTLEDHLKLAQDTNKAVGTSGTKASKKPVGK